MGLIGWKVVEKGKCVHLHKVAGATALAIRVSRPVWSQLDILRLLPWKMWRNKFFRVYGFLSCEHFKNCWEMEVVGLLKIL